MHCGAKTRSGGTCKTPAMENGRCRMHGGKSLKGAESATYRHGFYSKYASESLKSILDELQEQDSEDLMNPENEIRLMQALIVSAKALKNDLEDMRDLETLTRIIHQLVLSKQRSQQILLEEKRLIPATDIEKFLDYLDELLNDYVPNQALKITTEIRKFKIS